MSVLATGALLVGTVGTGLMAGLFAGFAYAVMPGLAAVDDGAFVEAMRRVNRAILNGWFLTAFLGSPVVTAVAAALHWRAGAGPVVGWIVGGLLCYAVLFGVTAAVNVPLNDRLAAAGNGAGAAAARAPFEARWVRWNLVRAVAGTAAFAVLAWALVLSGRLTG